MKTKAIIKNLKLNKYLIKYEAPNNFGEMVKCASFTNGYNEHDAVFTFGQINKGKNYFIENVQLWSTII
ncbi:Uncharacterised protein [Yersinia aldovae]|uniref:hypothetical protein n=1 Tax=Yersinia aldovae TaxID=29483 RepID=UPI0005DFF497|nr:hypothetical protein [Yersinia aldovae]CNK26023.1 Uncharacterised protein [Yersinia aldovae]